MQSKIKKVHLVTQHDIDDFLNSEINDNLQQQVKIRKLKPSSINKPYMNTVDCSCKPQKFITLIRTNTFPQNIQSLNVSGCNISSLSKMFSTINKEQLRQNNQIAARQKSIKKRNMNVTLEKRNTSNNKINMLDKCLQQQQRQSKIIGIQLSNSRQEQITQQLTICGLKQLILDNNLIELLPYKLISQLKHLKILSFNNNLITKLPDFYLNHNLTQLYGRMNPIKKIQIHSTYYNIKKIDFDWLDYIDISQMRKSKYRNQQWIDSSSFRGVGQQLFTQKKQKDAQEIYKQIVMQIKVQLVQRGDNSNRENDFKVQNKQKPSSQLQSTTIQFKQFMIRYFRIKNLSPLQYQQLIAYNLRKSILNQFDLFIDYCIKYLDNDSSRINCFQLKYKSTLLLQYVLQAQYQYGLLLFLRNKQYLLINSEKVLEIMMLACKYSSYKLFRYVFNVVKEQWCDMSKSKRYQDNNRCGQNTNNNNNNNTLRQQKQTILSFLIKDSNEDYQVQDHQMYEQTSFNNCQSQIQTQTQLIKPITLSIKSPLYRLIRQVIFHFDIGKKSHKILQLLIELITFSCVNHNNIANTRREKPSSNLPVIATTFRSSQSQYSIPSENDQPILNVYRHNHSLTNQPFKFHILLLTPSQSQYHSLTRQQLQSFISITLYIKQTPQLNSIFLTRQQPPYQSNKMFLQLAAAIKHNQLLMMLLQQYKFNVFNRNKNGKLARNTRVVIINKKVLYKYEQIKLDERYDEVKENNGMIRMKCNDSGRYNNQKCIAVEIQNNLIYFIERFLYGGSYVKQKESFQTYYVRSQQNNGDTIEHRNTSPTKIKNSRLRMSLQQQQDIQRNLMSINKKSSFIKDKNTNSNVSSRLKQKQINNTIHPQPLSTQSAQITFKRNQCWQIFQSINNGSNNNINSDFNPLIQNSHHINNQYQLLQEISFLNYLQSVNESREQLKNKGLINSSYQYEQLKYQQTIKSGLNKQTTKRESVFQSLSKNLLSCTCVQLENDCQQDQYYQQEEGNRNSNREKKTYEISDFKINQPQTSEKYYRQIDREEYPINSGKMGNKKGPRFDILPNIQLSKNKL